MLHTVNKSPFEKNSLDTCLRLAQVGSAILLIEDAVYAAMQDTSVAAQVQQAMNDNYRLYVLEPDMQARGLEPKRLIDGIERVDYAGFVKLVAEHERCQSWL